MDFRYFRIAIKIHAWYICSLIKCLGADSCMGYLNTVYTVLCIQSLMQDTER